MSNNSSIAGRVPDFDPNEAIFIVLGCLIIIFNACVLLVLWKKKVLQKSENALLGSLAVSDISVGLIGLPLLFTCSYVTMDLCIFCHISFVFFKFISVSTLLHILAIIADRYLRVKVPFVHRRLTAKTSRLTYLIAFIWVTSLSVANVQWIWAKVGCDPNESENLGHIKRYELTCFVLFFLIPLVLITFFLTNICLTARRYFRESSSSDLSHTKRSQSPKAELRVSIVLFTMFFLFVVCWFPYFYLLLSDPLGFEYPMWLGGVVVPIFRCLTATLNPLIYTFYKEDFYQAIKQVLCCCSSSRSEAIHANSTHGRVPLTGNDTRESLIPGSKFDQTQTIV